MTFGSICSGIEAASVAWLPLGWRCAWLSEIDSFPSAVLKHHYPDVRNYGDFTKITEPEPVDILIGGTPCQSFSVAGKREGLDDPRGNLTLEFLALAGRIRPRWLVWENVPGVMSDDGGRTFGIVLGLLGQLGYGFAYRILDAQYLGVPQRRRRVFVVGHLGDWRPAAAVLFERFSLSGYPPPSREARQDVAPTISARTKGGGGLGTDFDCDGGLIAKCLNAGGTNRIDAESDGFTPSGICPPITSTDGGGAGVPTIAFDARQDCVSSMDAFGSLGSSSPQAQAIAFNLRGREDGAQVELTDVASLRASSGGSSRSYVAQITVRRLTPVECERLQGFPDNYTQVPYRGKPAADGPRYKALGNSMAVPVIRWIGERIQQVDTLR